MNTGRNSKQTTCLCRDTGGGGGKEAAALLCYCLELRWPIRDGDRVGRGRQSEGSTAEATRKRPERPWTTARTMEVLRRCPLAIAQRLVHCAIAVSTAVLGQSHKDNVRCTAVDGQLGQLEAKEVQLVSPAPPPYTHDLFWAKLKVQLHLPPLRSLDLLISPGTLGTLLAQRTSFNTLDNWGHKTTTQCNRKRTGKKRFMALNMYAVSRFGLAVRR